MRGAFFWVVLLVTAGCTKGSGDVVGHHPDMGSEGGTGDLGAPDLGGTACTMDSQCGDSMDCTIDHCGVGNVCTHTDTCASPLRCMPGGCMMVTTGACSSDPECDDHDACNGVEACIIGTHMCVPGRALNCNDGDSCTDDGCDSASGHCTHATVCDGGTMGTDAGPGPFDPATDYPGMYAMIPAANSGCGCATFSVNTLTFSIVGADLHVTTAPTSLGTFVQSPAPTGPSFDVSLSTSCGDYRITGTFTDRDTFGPGGTGSDATWSATFSSGLCPAQNNSIVGVRR